MAPPRQLYKKQQPLQQAPDFASTSAESKAAEERVKELMKKSIVSQNPEKLYTSYSNGGIVSKEERKAAGQKKKREERDSLSQWYGMKRYSKNLSSSMRKDLELLRYRNFLNKDTAHLASARSTSKKISPFFEVGYFTDATKKQKQRSRTFADEMMNSDPELRQRVNQVAKREVARRKKDQEKAAKKRKMGEMKEKERKKKSKKSS